MSFKWEKGYGTHECRRSLIFCAYRKEDMKVTMAVLESAGYDCEKEEILEYLKQHPITKKELRWQKDLELEMEAFFKRVVEESKSGI